MNIEQVSPSYACSTVLLGDLGEVDLLGQDKEDHASSLKDFVKQIQRAITLAEEGGKDEWGNHLYPVDPFDETPVEIFSFMIASTMEYQPTIRKYLDEIGFHAMPETYNDKNGSRVILHVIPIPLLFKRMEEIKNG